MTLTGQPFVNFMFATMLFFFVAKELYRLTMCLRGMIIPEDKTLALTNMAGATAVCVLSYVFTAYIDLFYIELCHGYLSMPRCRGYHIEGSYRVVYWRANAGLVFFYRILQYIISLAYNITNINTNIHLHNNTIIILLLGTQQALPCSTSRLRG